MVSEFETLRVAIYAPSQLVVARVTGAPGQAELRQVAQQILPADAAMHDLRALVDLRQLTGTHLTSSHIQCYLRRLDTAFGLRGEQGASGRDAAARCDSGGAEAAGDAGLVRLHIAFCADPGSLGYAMARMCHAHAAERQHLEVEIFEIPDAAEAWAGRPGILAHPDMVPAALTPVDRLRAEVARTDTVLTDSRASEDGCDAQQPVLVAPRALRGFSARLQPLLQGIKLRNT